MAGIASRERKVGAYRGCSRDDGSPNARPPTFGKQSRRLLNDALEAHRPEFTAYQRVGLNLTAVAPDSDPEPDVAVIGSSERGDIRYSDRFFLAAEIVSMSDKETIRDKRDIYKRHPDCRCVLIMQQGRFDVMVDVLTDAGWTERRLTQPDDELTLEDFGLRCTLADLYRGTALQPRAKR